MSDWFQPIVAIAQDELAAGADEFMGLPDRWYEKPGPKWRCVNDHVSVRYLKSERHGFSVCLACQTLVFLTFPEDVDGPLKAP